MVSGAGNEELRGDPNYPHYKGGFEFENFERNKVLGDALNNGKMPKTMKTGTTIVGLVFKDGVVLGADTRATSNTVCDKNCEKIHYIAPNIYCCGAGTAADTEMTTGQISSQLELLRLNTGTESRVITALTKLKRHLFNYQGHVSAALVLGGFDVTGPQLWSVHPHGSTDKLPYMTMGSGTLAAMSVFESEYKDGMTEEEAIKLAADAVLAGVFNDLGSGSNVDLCIIKKNSVDYKRNYLTPNSVEPLRAQVNKPPTFGHFPKGTTITVGKPVVTDLVDVTTETMDLS